MAKRQENSACSYKKTFKNYSKLRSDEKDELELKKYVEKKAIFLNTFQEKQLID